MKDLSQYCCQNESCPDYGKRGAGNLTLSGRYGKSKHSQLLRCRTCGKRFSERKGTPLFGSRLDEEKVVSVLKHIAEGCGIRQTSRLTGVHRDTVARYVRLAGEHAQALHDELVAFSPSNPGGTVRREVGLRGEEGEALRPRRSGGPQAG